MMAWFKVDDQLHGHPKPRKAGLEAIGLWTVAGSHTMAYKGGGFVPTWYVDSWPKGRKLAAQLVDANLWKPGEKDGLPGFYFHDFHDYQPTADEIERDREASRIRQKNRRERLRQAAFATANSNGSSHAVTNGVRHIGGAA